MRKPFVKVLVDHRCVPQVSVVLPSGEDVTRYIRKVIGTVTVEELTLNDDHVNVDFGDNGILPCSRSEVTFIADFTAG
ncbi:MAG: hypothetical protein ABIH38_01495 [Patescibacteria group bacterium]